MYNDDENANGTNLYSNMNNGVNPSENSDTTQSHPDDTQKNDMRQQMPSYTQPAAKEAAPNPYYEPWQQPVYRETKAPMQEPYSPGMHNGAYNAYQRYQPKEPQPEKKKKSAFGGFVKAVCLVLVCLIAGGGAGYGVLRYGLNDFKNDNQIVLGGDTSDDGSTSDPSEDITGNLSTPNATDNMTSTGTEMSPESIYTMAVNQVVGVNSEEKTNVFGAPSSGAVSGSGFIISSDGYIVTNYHVIQYAVESGFSLTVMMYNGESYPAEVIGSEPDNDLAVIKIDATGLDAVTMGSNDTMQVGEEVYAVGNPLGELVYTMTNGIVSALDREIQVDETTSINMFQIDAAVNPGNSGGPLYNAKGEVIGIVSAKYFSSGIEGLGFAIPINDAEYIIEQLMTNGYVSGKPTMGISVSTVTQQQAEYYDTVQGALIASVTKGSCAEIAGLKIGDIIIKLGDFDVTSKETLLTAKKTFRAGDTATIVVNRDGEVLSLEITFDEEGITATSSTQQPSVTQLPAG